MVNSILSYFEDGKCFGNKHAQTKYICESKYDDFGRHTGPGVWDKPCLENDECPFYQKNKNYENERGGCINGYCELPVNMERVGHRYYKETEKPFCYNCEDPTDYECCDDQLDETDYPDLESPDYMFEGDTLDNRN